MSADPGQREGAVRPIIFSAPMVRALLDGRKTQTRRVMTRCNVEVLGYSWASKKSPWEGLRFAEATVRETCLAVPFCHPDDEPTPTEDCGVYRIRPVVEPDDLLWVREAHSFIWPGDSQPERKEDNNVEYRADTDGRCLPGEWPDNEREDPDCPRWHPSIHMPRWASRLTLEVTDTKIERLNDISEDDAEAEGWPAPEHRAKTGVAEIRDAYPIGWYAALWDSINGKGAWGANPFVVAITFTVHRANVDSMTLPVSNIGRRER